MHRLHCAVHARFCEKKEECAKGIPGCSEKRKVGKVKTYTRSASHLWELAVCAKQFTNLKSPSEVGF